MLPTPTLFTMPPLRPSTPAGPPVGSLADRDLDRLGIAVTERAGDPAAASDLDYHLRDGEVLQWWESVQVRAS